MACEHTFVFDEATILHADVDSFFAAVEQRDDPRLRGRPVIVGPGVVMAASYEARAFGVRSAMGGRQARRLCPHAAVVPPRFEAYVEASRALFDVFERTAPTVEGLSLEEAFLDVSGLERISGSPVEIAIALRREVRERVGLPITVGIADGRTLAKVASGLAKPDGLLLVIPGREREFLRPLPVRRLWGVGAATAEKLNARGLTTVGQLAELSRQELVAILGRASGRHVHALAHARDARRVRRVGGRRSIGSQSALGRTTRSAAALDLVLVGLVDRVTRRMRSAGRAGRTVTLRIRFGDFQRATRSRSLAQATAATEVILAAARTLLRKAMPTIERRGATLLGITVSNLGTRGAVQLELPLGARGGSALDAAIDEIRERFGTKALTRASLLGRAERFDASLLAGERARRSEARGA
jgi:DNA polymerase-4